MADIKVRIEVNPNAESEVLGDVNNVNAEVSNVSVKTNASNVFQNIPTSESSGINGLSFAQDFIFDEQGYVDNEDMQCGVIESEQDPTEFVWGVVPENKQYSVKLTFTNAQNLKDIVVYGDKTVNQFPTRAIIDGTTEMFSDDYRWAINLQTEGDTHTIEFTHWNRANYNACLTLIRIMMRYFEVDNRNGLKTVESLSQSTGQPKEILYGVVPSSGSLKVVDIDGEISEMIRDGIIPISNSHIEIISNGKQTQSHISVDSDYDNNAKTLSVDFTNDLTKWNDLQYNGFTYPKKSENSYNILLDVLSSIGYTQGQVDEMLSTKIAYGVDNEVGTIKQYLEQIIIRYPYLPQASVRETIDKFCTLAQLQVFKTDEDKIKFVSARPVATNEEKGNVLFIDKGSIFGNFTKNILLKNKYDAVEISENKVTDMVDFDALIRTAQLNINTYSYYNSNYKGALGSVYSYAFKIESYYTDGEIYIEKNGDDNLSEIVSINSDSGTDSDGFAYISKRNGIYPFEVKYKKSYGSFKNTSQALSDINNASSSDASDSTFATNEYYYNVNFSNVLQDVYSGRIPNSYNSETANNVNVSVVDESYLKIKDVGDRYLIKYHILSRSVYYDIWINDPIGSPPTGFYDNTKITKNEAFEITISIYGNKRQISFSDVSVSDSFNSKSNFVRVQANDLLQSNTTFNDMKMSDIIKTNIKSDYANGISNATMTVACVDYYDENRKKIKDWAKGEIFEVGDIVKVECDNSLWRVTGRNFKKSGVPLIDLELQEIKILG